MRRSRESDRASWTAEIPAVVPTSRHEAESTSWRYDAGAAEGQYGNAPVDCACLPVGRERGSVTWRSGDPAGAAHPRTNDWSRLDVSRPGTQRGAWRTQSRGLSLRDRGVLR